MKPHFSFSIGNIFQLLYAFVFLIAVACETHVDDLEYSLEEDGGDESLEPFASSSAKYQAEQCTAQKGSVKKNHHGGYSGSGYMDYGGSGTWIEWQNVQADQSGNHKLTLRYANGKSGETMCQVLVNGKSAGQVSFKPTGAWKTWDHDRVAVSLKKGANTIRIQATTSFGGPNLDRMVVRYSGGDDGGGDGGEEPPDNCSNSTCSSSCPCGEGKGDCDTDADCESGLMCKQQSGTDFCVRPGDDDGNDDGNDDNNGSAFTFFAIADSRTHQDVFQQLIRSMVKLDPAAIAIFNSGDLTSDGNSAQWKTHVKMLREGGGGRARADLNNFSSDAIRYFGALGNHDDGSSSWFDNWNRYLPGQKNLGRNSKNGIYFSVKYKNAIFIVLDSVHPSSTQKKWLKSQLINAESSHIRWKFVFFHHPIYPCNSKLPFDEGAEDWVDAFEQYKVDIVFVADSHTYERTCPMRRGECDPTGVVYLNTSGAGAPTRSTSKSKSARAGADSYRCREILEASKGNWDHYCHFMVTNSAVTQKCYSHNKTNAPDFNWTLRK